MVMEYYEALRTEGATDQFAQNAAINWQQTILFSALTKGAPDDGT
jgi:hypothetical protein